MVTYEKVLIVAEHQPHQGDLNQTEAEAFQVLTKKFGLSLKKLSFYAYIPGHPAIVLKLTKVPVSKKIELGKLFKTLDGYWGHHPPP